jgi:multidrug efflux pump
MPKIDVKDAVDKAKQDLPQGDVNFKEPVISDINVADLAYPLYQYIR